MIRVYKQEVDIGRPIYLKNNAEIIRFLDLQKQRDKYVFWYLANTDIKENYVIYECWTGDKVRENASYIGTVQEDVLVFHFFLEKEKDFDITNY